MRWYDLGRSTIENKFNFFGSYLKTLSGSFSIRNALSSTPNVAIDVVALGLSNGVKGECL